MIRGVGIDLIEVDRIKKQLEKSRDRFCQSLFSEEEIAYCRKGANTRIQAQHFAGRFAAKEAFLKAIGTGLREGLAWKDVEVLNNAMGKPELHLKNKAKETVDEHGITNIQLSISHGRDIAAAFVILETQTK